MMEIQGLEIRPDHIGHNVTYIPDHAKGIAEHPDIEHGVISSYNDKDIWVKFSGSTGQRCNTKNLKWGKCYG